jgi:hypothetical protein
VATLTSFKSLGLLSHPGLFSPCANPSQAPRSDVVINNLKGVVGMRQSSIRNDNQVMGAGNRWSRSHVTMAYCAIQVVH